ncbi:tyrosine-type recombinase/integrase [Nocardioides sp. MH1]|uniref:tyrosine-type recombinase/integrase n=1 Tax=Nocardioides sp. MH1 TaxID=3242490 RepID=UPI0035225362
MMRAFVQHMENTGVPTGTRNQYRSNFNAHILDAIGEVKCADLSIRSYTALMDAMTAAGDKGPTIKAVNRTLNSMVSFGEPRGYFPTENPFGTDRQRKSVFSEAMKTAARRSETPRTQIRLDHCPSRTDVEKFAVAFERAYPGFGFQLVLLAYSTGLRIGEILALRICDILDNEDGDIEISVTRQLDRHQPWPATVPPKGGRPRTTIVWDYYRWVLEDLTAKARARTGAEHGWLFPRHPSSQKAWLRYAGGLATVAATESEWGWNFHWLRHAFASVSLAPQSAGGYELELASVQRYLGHRKPSTTQDMYLVPQKEHIKNARRRTKEAPGH